MVQRLSHELRSEKARNIISPISSKLIKYGIASIVFSVLLLIALMALIPIKNSISGIMYIRKTTISPTGLIKSVAYVDFSMVVEEDSYQLEDASIEVHKKGHRVRGIIDQYKPVSEKTKNKEYIFYISSRDSDIVDFKNRISSFTIELNKTSLLSKIMNSIKIKPN